MNKQKMATLLTEAKKFRSSNTGLKYYMNKRDCEDILAWSKGKIKNVVIYQSPRKA